MCQNACKKKQAHQREGRDVSFNSIKTQLIDLDSELLVGSFRPDN
uniref:Uncharacterized protein n=1 Tax=Arundo donax TaxID=35708 RepID=A0A0A9G0I1_ARUDO